MVLVAVGSAEGRILAGAVVAATLSDIFDGKVARRFGVATAVLRRFDSIADTVFYIGTGSALWITLILLDWQHDVHHVRNALRPRRAKRRRRQGS